MKILFVTDRRVNAGSIQAVAGYVRAGDRCGHTFAVWKADLYHFAPLLFR